MLFDKQADTFKHIIVLVDGTEAASCAVAVAVDVAHALHSRLTALSLVETDTLNQLLRAKILSDVEMTEFETGLSDSAVRHLAAACEVAAKKGVKLETAIIKGNSEHALPKEVAARGASLIVIGAFDSGDAKQDLIARQRQQIVDHAPCPVLVAR